MQQVDDFAVLRQPSVSYAAPTAHRTPPCASGIPIAAPAPVPETSSCSLPIQPGSPNRAEPPWQSQFLTLENKSADASSSSIIFDLQSCGAWQYVRKAGLSHHNGIRC